MIQFFYNSGPNPMKVALCLEEMGLPYEPVPVDTRKGQQHTPDFLAINPNAKLPAMVDGDATIFDSNAIALYLADKTGRFAPPPDQYKARGEMLSWLMFIASGIGPYSGQAVHFRDVAPEPKEYARERYTFEAIRHWSIVDAQLQRHRYILGDDYGIVDMCLWGWARLATVVMGDDALERLPHLKRHLEEVSARPAAQRATALKDRHAFQMEMTDQARIAMYPHIKDRKTRAAMYPPARNAG